jgi:hypothetical protein
MTMLYSFYAAEGIVFAADSRITHDAATQPLAPQRKVLRLPGFGVSDGLIGFFGLAQVAGRPMSDWLSGVIAKYPAFRDADSFARYLAVRVEGEATARELEHVSGFHIGMFEERDGQVVPTFTFLRNGADIKDGVYVNIGRFLPPEEHLLGRDYEGIPASGIRQALRGRQTTIGTPHWYRNGDIVHFGAVGTMLELALHQLVTRNAKTFRAPRTIAEWSRVARTLVASTGNLYRSYYSDAVPPVGGRVYVEAVAWPA